MPTVADRRLLKVAVFGNLGSKGLVQLLNVLEERGKVELDLFSAKGKSELPSDAALFNVETDVDDAELEHRLRQVRGVEDVNLKP